MAAPFPIRSGREAIGTEGRRPVDVERADGCNATRVPRDEKRPLVEGPQELGTPVGPVLGCPRVDRLPLRREVILGRTTALAGSSASSTTTL